MKIKEIRRLKNLTQSQLASKIGVKRTTLTMWENGKSMPSILVLKKIAKVLNSTIGELVEE